MRATWVKSDDQVFRPGRNLRLEEMCIGAARVFLTYAECAQAAGNRTDESLVRAAFALLESTAKVNIDAWLEVNSSARLAIYTTEPQPFRDAVSFPEFELSMSVMVAYGLINVASRLYAHYDSTPMYRFLNQGRYPPSNVGRPG